jgi:hypothetical protein
MLRFGGCSLVYHQIGSSIGDSLVISTAAATMPNTAAIKIDQRTMNTNQAFVLPIRGSNAFKRCARSYHPIARGIVADALARPAQ